MKLSSRSLLIFGSLTILVIFLGGFRFGRFVEKADQTYIPPTRIPSPTKQFPTTTPIPLVLKTFIHPCGVSFSYPSTLLEEENSSTSAKLQDGTQSIAFNCTKIASISAKLTPTTNKDDNTTQWEVKNTKTRTITSFTVSSNLSELIQKTLTTQ